MLAQFLIQPAALAQGDFPSKPIKVLVPFGPGSTPDVFAYADLVDAGLMPGPRVYATGPGVFSGSGIDSREAAFRFIKRYKEAYRTNTLKQYVAGDRIVRQWIIEACKE